MQSIFKKALVLAASVYCTSSAYAQTEKETAFINTARTFASGLWEDKDEASKLDKLQPAAAVKYVAKKAEVISQSQSNSLTDSKVINAKDKMVSDIALIPAGYIIGFGDGVSVQHVMISVGNGMAYGTDNYKNIGLGTNDKWELIALKDFVRTATNEWKYKNKTFLVVSKSVDEILNTNSYAVKDKSSSINSKDLHQQGVNDKVDWNNTVPKPNETVAVNKQPATNQRPANNNYGSVNDLKKPATTETVYDKVKTTDYNEQDPNRTPNKVPANSNYGTVPANQRPANGNYGSVEDTRGKPAKKTVSNTQELNDDNEPVPPTEPKENGPKNLPNPPVPKEPTTGNVTAPAEPVLGDPNYATIPLPFNPMIDIKNVNKHTTKDWSTMGDPGNANPAMRQFQIFQQKKPRNSKVVSLNQYIAVAFNFLADHPVAQEVKMPNGDLVLYDANINLLAVYDNQGKPKEMYCPDSKEELFKKYQIKAE